MRTMKLILLAVIATFAVAGLVLGQSAKPNGALETVIRKLDHAEAEGLLHKDVAAWRVFGRKILLSIIRVTE